ncbi:MAG: ABC-F family ATP-binding cassette domain-containing protein [Anaerolineales bacterium]|nr:MAG: ABC-F family ATP-binding cassette domain-containing protein [Anaerolineales bacterium]
MNLVTLNNLTIKLAGREIFRTLSWAIKQNDRVGLIGPNGAGKSTLFKVLVGEVSPDAGTITRYPHFSLGYLPQQLSFETGRSLLDIALEMPSKLAQVEQQLKQIEEQLEKPEVYGDPEKLARLLDRQSRVLVDYEILEIARFENRIEGLLSDLGFTTDDYAIPTEGLSGGQKKMLALAKLALEKPDLLLLDEPDNHLDLRGKGYLEKFVRNYPGAVVIVSHDRYLLDEIATQIAELENGQLTIYKGNYTAYKTEREIRRLRQQQLYSAQQKEIARIEAAIKRFEQWARIVVDERHIRQARHRRKMLERMEADGEIIQKVTEQRVMDIRIEGWRGSTKAIELLDLGMRFDTLPLFQHLNLVIYHGDRVGLVGPNGAGKSVLFRVIRQELHPQEGEIRLGPSTRLGYYAQEHQSLDGWWERTPMEYVRHARPMSENAAVAQLIKFAFVYEQVRLPIHTLSGGERSRLQLLNIMLNQPNCLLLDEPTNNLDIRSMEVLEQALDEFEGALVIISHDRYFLDQTVERVIELESGQLTSFSGGYTDYIFNKST